MAKQSKSALLSGFTEEEIETANTMLEFHQQFVEFKTHPQIQSWVGLKRRSKRLPRQSLGCFHFSLSSSPAFTHGGVEVGPTSSPKCKTEAPTVAVKAGTLSPVTPLSFSLSSESDDKPKNALKFKIVKRVCLNFSLTFAYWVLLCLSLFLFLFLVSIAMKFIFEGFFLIYSLSFICSVY